MLLAHPARAAATIVLQFFARSRQIIVLVFGALHRQAGGRRPIASAETGRSSTATSSLVSASSSRSILPEPARWHDKSRQTRRTTFFGGVSRKWGKKLATGVESILRHARLFRKGLERFWFQITKLFLNAVQGRHEHR